MKYYYTLLVFAFIACTQSKKTENQEKDLVNKDVKVERQAVLSKSDINDQYVRTMELVRENKLDTIAFKYNCNGERAGKITFYKEDNKLRLIEKSYSEYSHTEGKEQYFILNDSLYFVFKKNVNWHFSRNAAVEGETVDVVKEQRYYILKNEIIECLMKDYEVNSSKKDSFNENSIANKKGDCSSFDEISENYKQLLKYLNQKNDIDCL